MPKGHHGVGGYIGAAGTYATGGRFDLRDTQVLKSNNAWGASWVTSGLLIHLDAGNTSSYSGSGTAWNDLSGNGSNFTLGSSSYTTYSGTDGGGCFVTSYTSVDTATATIASYNLQRNFSLEIWVKNNQLTPVHYFGQGTGGTNTGLHIWQMNSTPTTRFGMYSNDTDFGTSMGASTSVWYHNVFTYSHSSPYAKGMYQNGVSKTGTPQQTQAAYAGSGVFRIGNSYSSSVQSSNHKIAIVRVYDHVLSQAEVTQNFDAQKARFGY